MPDALVGHSGFVGTTLQRQTRFDALYRSTNIGDIDRRSFDRVICAGAPAQKWIANRDPAADRQRIDDLISHLDTIVCRSFVLISTVDVFKVPIAVDEESAIDETDLMAYGANRRRLERFVEGRFPDSLIVRLPGLVGPGLRKNAIFDLLNDNNVAAIDSRGLFQFYPMVNLWADIAVALAAGLRLVHLTAEPISLADVAAEGFGRDLRPVSSAPPTRYDLRTRHAALFGAAGNYQYDRRASILAVRSYAQSEPRSSMGG
jgi:nucleoside-diphosphate-sugar epimerase